MVEEKKYGFDLNSVEAWMTTEEEPTQIKNSDDEDMYSVTQQNGEVWHFSKEGVAQRIINLGNKKDAIEVPELSESPTDSEQAEYDSQIKKQESYQDSIDEFQELIDSME